MATLSLAVAAARAGAADVVELRVAATSGPTLAEWDGRVARLLAAGELTRRLAREDTLLVGRTHERFTQLYQGVPVFGGEVARQTDERGATLTVFGTLYEGIELDVRPAFGPEAIDALLAGMGVVRYAPDPDPELVVLPRESDYVLAYRVRGVPADRFDLRAYFIDARTRQTVLEYTDLQTQSVGSATGVLGDAKKISTQQSGSTYVAKDALRPPLIKTYDLKGNVNLFLAWDAGRVPITDANLASDSDNVWTDGANVDAHVYAGYTYDFYYKRFGRRGLDNANIPIFSITHPIRREDIAIYANSDFAGNLYCNAAYLGGGVIYYGEGLPPGWTCGGRTRNYYSAALDIVGHELTHGVTSYSSRLIYLNESGALNESFSDIMGTSIEFFFQPRGNGPLMSDWLQGEDVEPGGTRSLQNPAAFGDPDHYSIRYTGSADNGGVHTNSTISSHAFYLAVEGGTNRVSGLSVQGVGFANIEQMEKVFYRAFTSFLIPSANFSAARAATIQAARELYGIGSPAERAVTQAWTAVGVN
jgi:thermolysin